MPYFVKRHGGVEGPLSSGDLRKLAVSGSLRGCSIGKAAAGPWTPAERVKELASLFPAEAAPPPLPPPRPAPASPVPVRPAAATKDASPGTWRFYLRRAVTQAAASILLAILGVVALVAGGVYGVSAAGAVFLLAEIVSAVVWIVAVCNGIVAIYKFLMQV